jgi:hypothetical protein
MPEKQRKQIEFIDDIYNKLMNKGTEEEPKRKVVKRKVDESPMQVQRRQP